MRCVSDFVSQSGWACCIDGSCCWVKVAKMEDKIDPTEVPMLKLNINGDDEEKADVVADKKNQYLATVAGEK